MINQAPLGADRPRFSIVIPAFNEEFYLGECLKSLAAQDYPGAFEVIVVDNNSSDRTAQMAASLGATVVAEPEPGVCRARQRGTAAALGEIIVSADADTTYPPGWLSKIAQWFDDHEDCVAVGGPCYFADGPRWGRALQQGLFGGVALIRRLRGPVLYITATNFAFQRTVWPGYDTRLVQGGDELDLLRRLRKAGRVDFTPTNPAWTSARRMERGILYNFAVSFFYYYILGYALNRVFGRPVVGTAPAFRRSATANRMTVAVRGPVAHPPAPAAESGPAHPTASTTTAINIDAAEHNPATEHGAAHLLERWPGDWNETSPPAERPGVPAL